jgi:hypothetical protein
MFNHGFLIGSDPLFYPKKIIGTFTNDNPLFAINPSCFYNYSRAIVENNWALAFVTAAHLQNGLMPWLDIGGNPRGGQDAYVAASYLIKYGATDLFYKIDEHNKGSVFYNRGLAECKKFMKNNRVIFAGHSIGGAHAQAAATGFEKLQELGRNDLRPFDPVIFDREFLPAYSERMSKWLPEERAEPVGLIQLSPVDQKIAVVSPGMQPYREALASKAMPSLMVIGQCDCACLDTSQPPAWSPDDNTVTQFGQLAPAHSSSWAAVTNIERGSHCGFLTQKNGFCTIADVQVECPRCPGVDVYTAAGDQTVFTTDLFRRFIAMYPENGGGFQGDFNDWVNSGFMQWLNRESPGSEVRLVPFKDGRYVQFRAEAEY